MAALTPPPLRARWAQATRPCRGERRNGDRCFIREEGDILTIAVLDIAGHGEPAADLADILEGPMLQRLGAPPDETLRWAHAMLKASRGASMGVARFDLSRRLLSWAATGNVTCRVVGGAQLVSRDGLLGARMSTPRIEQVPLASGTTWLIASDGLLRDAGATADAWRTAEEQVRHMLAEASRPLDDATCAVVQVLA